MKKMTKTAQMSANGGWGYHCGTCNKHGTTPAAFSWLCHANAKAHKKLYPRHYVECGCNRCNWRKPL